MKKFTLTVLLGIFTIGCAFSQMSFNGNKLTKSALSITANSDEQTVKEIPMMNSKIVITNEEEETMRRRKHSHGGGDFQLLSYSRFGVTIPTSTLSDWTGTGFFALGTIEGIISNQFSVGLSFGYYVYPGKSYDISVPIYDPFTGVQIGTQTESGTYPNMAVIPVSGTFKYFLSTEEFKPYVGADLGVAFITAAGGGSETKFGFTPRAGFMYLIADSYMVGVDASYNVVQDGSSVSIGLQLGYVFGN